jgi:hypothetical protein
MRLKDKSLKDDPRDFASSLYAEPGLLTVLRFRIQFRIQNVPPNT